MTDGTCAHLDAAPADPRGVVLVVHEAPAYRRGVAAALREVGFAVREESRFPAADEGWDVCLLAPQAAGGRDALAAARGRGRPAVAVLADSAPADYQRALRGGAAGAVAQDAPLRQIVDVVDAALRGDVLLPADVARALVEMSAAVPDVVELPAQVAEWLRALSQGVPIATIARNAGYSERQMYRQMQQLYRRIGARNRGEAICMAAKWGIDAGRSVS